MKITITSIELKSLLHFFALSRYALDITRQLKATDCVSFKKRGFWTTHYTMTLWNNEAELKAFAHSGAHLDAMKKGRDISKEIRTLTLDAESLPNWKDAIARLNKEGKLISYGKAHLK